MRRGGIRVHAGVGLAGRACLYRGTSLLRLEIVNMRESVNMSTRDRAALRHCTYCLRSSVKITSGLSCRPLHGRARAA